MTEDTRDDNQQYLMEQYIDALEADLDVLRRWSTIRDIYDDAWTGDNGRLQQGLANLANTIQALREREWKVR